MSNLLFYFLHTQTLFVSRINYYTSESKLRREFESFGAIKKIVLVQNNSSEKPRGYCFIEYEHERDMHCEWKKKQHQPEKSTLHRPECGMFFLFCFLPSSFSFVGGESRFSKIVCHFISEQEQILFTDP